MKQLFLTISFLALGCEYLCSQGFSKNYLLDRYACSFSCISMKGDTLLTHGFVVDTFAPYPSKFVIAELDVEGNVLTYHSEPFDTPSSYITQGRFITEGDFKITFVGSMGVYDAGVLVRLNKSGEVDLHKEFIDSSAAGVRFKEIIQLPDSSYIILAEQYDASVTLATAIWKVSYVGHKVWKKVVSFVEQPTSIVLVNDTLIVSTTKSTGSGMNTKLNTKFYSITLEGDVADSWADSSGRSYGANKYIALAGGGGVYVGQWAEAIISLGGNPPSYAPIKKGYIVREDGLHNKIWDIKLGHPSGVPNLFQCKVLNDGNFLAVGGTADTTYSDGQPYKNTGWLVKFDVNGNVIWERRFFITTDKPAQTNYLHDFIELADGSIVATGESIDYFVDYPQRGWVLKLDQYGCLIPGCQSVGIDKLDTVEAALSLFPNPAQDFVYVSVNRNDLGSSLSLAIFSLNGEVVKNIGTVKSKGTYIIPTEGLAAGVYSAALFEGGVLRSTIKFIKK